MTEDKPKLEEEQIVTKEEEEIVDESKLPFPRATIVNMLRKHLTSGKQIKGQVKNEMNIWLGKMVERIAEKMDIRATWKRRKNSPINYIYFCRVFSIIWSSIRKPFPMSIIGDDAMKKPFFL